MRNGNGGGIVISTPLRTAIGTFGGTLEDVPAVELGATVAREMGGLPFLRAILAGEQPPIGEHMGFEPLEVEEGRALFGCEPAEYHYNPLGTGAWRAPSSTRRWAAPCTPCSLPVSGTPRSS